MSGEVLTLLGAWLSIFLTLCIFSYLYADNPLYKIAEHLFLGVSIGIGVVQQFYNAFKPNLLDKLADGNLISLFPLLLCILLFLKVGGRSVAWMARLPIAFLVAAYAGVKLTGEASGSLMRQVAETMPNLRVVYEMHGLVDPSADYAGVLSSIFLVVGLAACLLHFYFSAPHSPVMRGISRFGVLVLMLSFGASFGFTVMGRISLAIGRAQELFGSNLNAAELERVQPLQVTLVSLAIIIVVLVVWQRFEGAKAEDPN
ncbi:MAG: hypothetical protein AAGA48_19955 [Myxococcota bacterium]